MMLLAPQSVNDLLREIRKLDPLAEVKRDSKGYYYLASSVLVLCGDGVETGYAPHLPSEREAIYAAFVALSNPQVYDTAKDHIKVLGEANSPFAGKRLYWDASDGWREFRLH
jgi:hypothetical protein